MIKLVDRVEFIEEHLSDQILRNRLIHGYDGVNDETACYAIKELIGDLRDFSVVVLEWTRN